MDEQGKIKVKLTSITVCVLRATVSSPLLLIHPFKIFFFSISDPHVCKEGTNAFMADQGAMKVNNKKIFSILGGDALYHLLNCQLLCTFCFHFPIIQF